MVTMTRYTMNGDPNLPVEDPMPEPAPVEIPVTPEPIPQPVEEIPPAQPVEDPSWQPELAKDRPLWA